MDDLSDHPGFGLEAPHEIGVVGEFGQDDLDRHLAVDRRLLGAVDDAESAFADAFDQLIASDFPAAKIIHGSH